MRDEGKGVLVILKFRGEGVSIRFNFFYTLLSILLVAGGREFCSFVCAECVQDRVVGRRRNGEGKVKGITEVLILDLKFAHIGNFFVYIRVF